MQIARLQRMRQKYMDMYTDDLISREELNDKLGGHSPRTGSFGK